MKVEIEFEKGDYVLYKGEFYIVDRYSFKDATNVGISKPNSNTATYVLKNNPYGERQVIKLTKEEYPEYYL